MTTLSCPDNFQLVLAAYGPQSRCVCVFFCQAPHGSFRVQAPAQCLAGVGDAGHALGRRWANSAVYQELVVSQTCVIGISTVAEIQSPRTQKGGGVTWFIGAVDGWGRIFYKSGQKIAGVKLAKTFFSGVWFWMNRPLWLMRMRVTSDRGVWYLGGGGGGGAGFFTLYQREVVIWGRGTKRLCPQLMTECPHKLV